MINRITFENQKFETHGIIEPIELSGAKRVPEGWKPTADPENVEVRELIRNISWEKSDEYCLVNDLKMSSYDFVEKFCSIPTDTLKKTISGKCRLTRTFLAKYTVGLKLELNEANELFRMHSGTLNPTNPFDFIVYNALITKDDIDFFLDEVLQYLNINLDKDRL